MDANADNAAEEIHSHPPPEVSVTRHSPTESVVQALVADQSILSTLSQAIVSVIKQDLPGHAIDQSRAEKAAAPVGQSAEQSAVESVDQTGKVKATKRRLPIDVVVIDENTQSKRPRGDKSTSYSSSLQADQSSANEDNDLDGLLSPNSRWEPSEEFDTLLKALLKPLQCFERRTIIREFPRPASEGAFTPNLDNYLNSMISGAKTPDNSLRDIQDKILDVLGPLCALHENFTLMQVPRAFSGWQRSIQSPLPRLLSPHIKLSDHKHIIQGQEQSPIYPVPRAISAKTTSIVPARPSHLPSGMFRDFLNFPNNLPQAGQVKHFLATWEQITKDPRVLQVVSGYQIEFLDNPVQRNTPPPIPCSLDHQTIIDQEVWELLSKEAVHFVQPDSLQEPGFIKLPFCNTQKGWGPQASDKSKTPKLFHPIRTLQNGVHTHVKRSFKERGLHGENRPQRRMSGGFQLPPSEVGSPEYRPLCLPSLLPTRSLCKLASRPSNNSHRCIHPGLGDLSGLCLSSICPDRPMPSPNSEPPGVTHGVCSTSLASSALVSTTIRPVHRLPSPPTSSGRSTDPGKQNPLSQTPTASWVASVSRGYQTADISAQSREILLAAWRKNTTSAYSSAWTKWSSWCSQQVNVNPLSPSLTNVLDFLALQFHEGKEYRTVNVYRSALSAVLPLIDGHKAGSHPLVC